MRPHYPERRLVHHYKPSAPANATEVESAASSAATPPAAASGTASLSDAEKEDLFRRFDAFLSQPSHPQ